MAGSGVQMLAMMSLMHGQGKTETSNLVQSVKSKLGNTMDATTLPAKNATTNGVGFVLVGIRRLVSSVIMEKTYLCVLVTNMDLQVLVALYSG